MHIQRRVFIKAPPQLVWEVITDLHRTRHWAKGLDDYPYVSSDWPKEGANATRRCHAGPFKINFQLTLTESIPAKSLHITNRSTLGQALEVYSFTSSGDITTVWYDASDEPNFLGIILTPLIEKRLARRIDAATSRLKEYCESCARTRAP